MQKEVELNIKLIKNAQYLPWNAGQICMSRLGRNDRGLKTSEKYDILLAGFVNLAMMANLNKIKR